jgi:nucleoside-diphosphate-sugar epimerase
VPVNYYDLSKYVIDQYAKLSGKRCYGLRLGTVNGYSPALRTDLMINAMTISAADTGKVRVFDGHIHRPILGINDLARALAAIIDGDGPAGIYNMASFNSTVNEIAAEIAACMNCEVIEERSETANASEPYDFKIDCSKFCTAYSFEFKETVKSIVDSLAGKEYQKTSRHNKFEYR